MNENTSTQVGGGRPMGGNGRMDGTASGYYTIRQSRKRDRRTSERASRRTRSSNSVCIDSRARFMSRQRFANSSTVATHPHPQSHRGFVCYRNSIISFGDFFWKVYFVLGLCGLWDYLLVKIKLKNEIFKNYYLIYV